MTALWIAGAVWLVLSLAAGLFLGRAIATGQRSPYMPDPSEVEAWAHFDDVFKEILGDSYRVHREH